MKNTITFKVKRLGVTNTKGVRLSVTNMITRERFELPFDYSFNSIAAQFRNFVHNERPDLVKLAWFHDNDIFYISYGIPEITENNINL